MFLGTLGEFVEGDEVRFLAAEAADPQRLVEEDVAVALPADLREPRAESFLQRPEHGAGGGVFASLDEIVDQTGGVAAGAGAGELRGEDGLRGAECGVARGGTRCAEPS